MITETMSIEGVVLLTPRRFTDERGYFCESYNKRTLKDAGIDINFLQDNHSLSIDVGTLRGLHYQAPPFAQTKLVRCLSGSILDVVVDARRDSPTFGHWVSAELTKENGVQILVPKGCLHGFVTRSQNAEVSYKVDAHYDKQSDGSVMWNDPDLAIDWGLENTPPIISQKDTDAQTWSAFVASGVF